MRCLICGNKLTNCVCPRCGFDLSRCRERFPTLADDGKQPEAVWVALDRRFDEPPAPTPKPEPTPTPKPEPTSAPKPEPELKLKLEPASKPAPMPDTTPKKKKKLWLIPLAAALLALGLFIGLGSGGLGGSSSDPVAGRTAQTDAQQQNSSKTPAFMQTGTTKNYNVTVWVPSGAVDLTRQQIEDFNAGNAEGLRFNATVTELSESVAADQMLSSGTGGADLYFFPQDQLARLVNGGVLDALPFSYASAVSGENVNSSVLAGKLSGTQYAYPLTNDNGYFLYYDKSVIPSTDLDSLEKLIADCEASNKHFCMENETSAWYLASWFFGVGCRSEWELDSDGRIVGVIDDFNSDKGLIAAKGMKKLLDSKCYVSSSYAEEFTKGAAIVVTGTWAYEDIRSVLGDNLGATDLPSFEVDGKSYHLGSFSGCKLLGVKPQADSGRKAAVHALARYLTGEAAQLERFNALAWGPANINAANNLSVLVNPGLAALNKQNQYAVPQGQIDGAWWDIAKVIAYDVKEAKSETGLKKALQNYEDKITAIFGVTEAGKTAWGVIGAICGTSWDTDFPMTGKGGGIYESEVLELQAGQELKCRLNGSWDENYGTADGDNVVVEKNGSYIVRLDLNKGIVSLIAQ